MKHFEHTNKQFTINKLHKREKNIFIYLEEIIA